jgi:hypothetical protein
MAETLVRTQADLDAAIAAGVSPISLDAGADVCVTSGDPLIYVKEGQPRVVAWGSSQPRVVAWGSSQPRVVAWGFVQLALQGRVVATCGPHVQVLAEGADPEVSGGLLQRFALSTPADWCDYYGAQVVDGVARLFKAVGDDYRSGHGALYLPGTTVEATDWDGGRAECGGGLHFCAHPKAAQGYHAAATRFVACPVRLADCRPPQPTDQAPNKIKARAVCGPIVEVDEDGDPVPVTVTAAPESRTAAPVPATAQATPKRRARKPKKQAAAKGRRR